MIDGQQRFQKEKQFKADYGMTINEAELIIITKKRNTKELLHLRALVNGLDLITGEKASLDKESLEIITNRIIELET